MPALSQAKVFSIADGFWHLELDTASRELTTFGTPFGRYCWKRLPLGVSPATEIFQMRIHQFLEGLPGVFVIADDILIAGEGPSVAVAEQDHNQKLHALLRRCQDTGIKLNRDKFHLRLQSVSYMGHLLTSDGLKPDPQKVRAIQEMPRPPDVAGVRRVLGMVNYLSRFTGDLADLCLPLRQLTHRDVEWEWSHDHEQAFERLKTVMSEVPVVQYFDPAAAITVQCDASSTGIGAALLQEGRPVVYASRALTRQNAIMHRLRRNY